MAVNPRRFPKARSGTGRFALASVDRRLPGGPLLGRRCFVRGLIFGYQVAVDGELSQEVAVKSAQRLDAVANVSVNALQVNDGVVEMLGEPIQDLVRRHGRLGVVLPGPAHAGTNGGDAQRPPAEQGHCRRPGLPSQGLIEAQQRLDVGGSRGRTGPDLCKRVRIGAAAARDLFLGKVQLCYTGVHEVDETLNAVSGNRHTPHPTAQNKEYPCPIFKGRYSVNFLDGRA